MKELVQGGGCLEDIPESTIDYDVTIDEALNGLPYVDYALVLGLGELDIGGLKRLMQPDGGIGSL